MESVEAADLVGTWRLVSWETVSPGGLAATTRAYARIIDAVNELDLDVLRATIDGR